MLHIRFFKYLERHQLLLIFFLICIGWLLYHLSTVLILIFLVFILVSALRPVVEYLSKYLPRLPAVIVTVGIAILPIIGVAYFVVPPVVSQTESFINNFPKYVHSVSDLLPAGTVNAEQLKDLLASRTQAALGNFSNVTSSLFSSILTIITFIFMTLYWLLDHQTVKKSLVGLFPVAYQKTARRTYQGTEHQLGAWVRGQMVVSLVVASISWILFALIGLPYALPLALLAGLLEIIPTIGPLLGNLPALIIALTISPLTFLLTLISYLGIQIVEGNILVPKVMNRAVGLHPLITLTGILIGAQLLGIAGALLAVPFLSMCKVVLSTTSRS